MIDVTFSEHSVFTYCAEELYIGVWDHRDGWLQGPVLEGCLGSVQFANPTQAMMFVEMIELMLEKRKEMKEKEEK